MTKAKMIKLLDVRYNKLIKELEVDSDEVEFCTDLENDTIYGWRFFVPHVNMTYVLFIDKLTANIMMRDYEGDYFSSIC